jgi:hypothetical protein
MGVGMINRRQLLAGLLASVTLPRLPGPPGQTSYIMFEPIPLERLDRIVIDDPWIKTPLGWALNSAAKGEIVQVSVGGKRP